MQGNYLVALEEEQLPLFSTAYWSGDSLCGVGKDKKENMESWGQREQS